MIACLYLKTWVFFWGGGGTAQNLVCCMTENSLLCQTAQDRACSYFFHISLISDCGNDLCGCYISHM